MSKGGKYQPFEWFVTSVGEKVGRVFPLAKFLFREGMRFDVGSAKDSRKEAVGFIKRRM